MWYTRLSYGVKTCGSWSIECCAVTSKASGIAIKRPAILRGCVDGGWHARAVGDFRWGWHYVGVRIDTGQQVALSFRVLWIWWKYIQIQTVWKKDGFFILIFFNTKVRHLLCHIHNIFNTSFTLKRFVFNVSIKGHNSNTDIFKFI